MNPRDLKKLIGAEKYKEVAAHAKTLQAKGKGPDEIVAALRRKFPEIASPLIRHGWISVSRPFVR